MLSNKKPTPAMPERVIIFSGIMCDPEIGRTTAWIYVVLPKRLIGWQTCLRISSGQGQLQPDLSGDFIPAGAILPRAFRRSLSGSAMACGVSFSERV